MASQCRVPWREGLALALATTWLNQRRAVVLFTNLKNRSAYFVFFFSNVHVAWHSLSRIRENSK
jgi:hypothetical protein